MQPLEQESPASLILVDTTSPAAPAQQQSSQAENLRSTDAAGSSLSAIRQVSVSFLHDSGRHETDGSGLPHSTDPISTPTSNQFAVFTDESTSPDVEGSVNAMGTLSSFTDSAPARRYGNSSAVSFLHQIHRTLEVHPNSKALTSHNTSAGQDAQNQLLSLIGRSPDLRLEDYALPCRPLGDHLLQCYWDRVYTLYPFVHKPSFLISYNKIWSGELHEIAPSDGPNIGLGGSKCSASIFYCALNSIFALGCQFSDVPSEERNVLSASFFRRSMNLLHINIIDSGDIALLQTLLVIVQFLQSTQWPTRCWNTLGVAVRVAQGLGLYRDDGSFIKRSSIETEMRRRTWHGCVMLDLSIHPPFNNHSLLMMYRIVSMTLGRPSMTYGKIVAPQPLAVDDEYLSGTLTSCSQPQNVFPITTFFLQSIKLFGILGDILWKVYKPWNEAIGTDRLNEERLQENSMDTIIVLDCALSDFESNIPPQLRWNGRRPTEVLENRILVQQRNVLHGRCVSSLNLYDNCLMFPGIFIYEFYCTDLYSTTFVARIVCRPEQKVHPMDRSRWIASITCFSHL